MDPNSLFFALGFALLGMGIVTVLYMVVRVALEHHDAEKERRKLL